MRKQVKVSIIIRTKNEEKWISSCLEAVYRQEFTDFEVIIVDNYSTDRTIEKTKGYPIAQRVQIGDYLPGKALNDGIRASCGEFIVCISAHCIPTSNQWLGNLLNAFTADNIAGVYGRQEPMAFTPDVDKRDLINLFGLDKRVHERDPFFHNANSMIRRSVWDEFPFSESATNIEDRIWAKEVLASGFINVYEPTASVYHYHGVNQGRNIDRAKSIVRILEELHPTPGGLLSHDTFKTYAIIPCRGKVKRIGEVPLLEFAIQSVQHSKNIDKVVVFADGSEHLEIAESMGATPLERPIELSYDYIELSTVYEQAMIQLLAKGAEFPDYAFLAQESHPFRPKGLVDKMLDLILNSNCDCIFATQDIYNSLWQRDGESLSLLNEGFMPSRFKKPISEALYGLGCVLKADLVMEGKKMGNNTGLLRIDNPYSSFVANSDERLVMANALRAQWEEYSRSNPI